MFVVASEKVSFGNLNVSTVLVKEPCLSCFCLIFFIDLQPTEAWGFNTLFICTVLQCDLPPVRPYLGEPGPRFGPGTIEAGTLPLDQ